MKRGKKVKEDKEIVIDGPREEKHPVAVAFMSLFILGVVASAVWFFGFTEWGVAWEGNRARQMVDAPEDVVTSYPSVELSLNEVSLMMEPGGTSRVKPCIQRGRNATGLDLREVRLQWVSQNPEVAKVDEHGRVRAVGIGTATIKVTVENSDIDSNPAYCTVTVRNWKNALDR